MSREKLERKHIVRNIFGQGTRVQISPRIPALADRILTHFHSMAAVDASYCFRYANSERPIKTRFTNLFTMAPLATKNFHMHMVKSLHGMVLRRTSEVKTPHRLRGDLTKTGGSYQAAEESLF